MTPVATLTVVVELRTMPIVQFKLGEPSFIEQSATACSFDPGISSTT